MKGTQLKSNEIYIGKPIFVVALVEQSLGIVEGISDKSRLSQRREITLRDSASMVGGESYITFTIEVVFEENNIETWEVIDDHVSIFLLGSDADEYHTSQLNRELGRLEVERDNINRQIKELTNRHEGVSSGFFDPATMSEFVEGMRAQKDKV